MYIEMGKTKEKGKGNIKRKKKTVSERKEIIKKRKKDEGKE